MSGKTGESMKAVGTMEKCKATGYLLGLMGGTTKENIKMIRKTERGALCSRMGGST